jgi:hypothetical protein
MVSSRKTVPAQTVDATLACSLLAGVWKPKVFDQINVGIWVIGNFILTAPNFAITGAYQEQDLQ